MKLRYFHAIVFVLILCVSVSCKKEERRKRLKMRL